MLGLSVEWPIGGIIVASGVCEEGDDRGNSRH
jgi:hypothetical protein